MCNTHIIIKTDQCFACMRLCDMDKGKILKTSNHQSHRNAARNFVSKTAVSDTNHYWKTTLSLWGPNIVLYAALDGTTDFISEAKENKYTQMVS